MTRTVAFVLALAALTVLVAEAAAEQTKFSTRPTIHQERSATADKLFGKLRSKAHACESNRKVKLHHRPVTQERKSSVIAKLRTNSKGKWTFRPKKNQNGYRFATPGDYQVKVGEKQVSTGSGEITCKRKNSSSLYVS